MTTPYYGTTVFNNKVKLSKFEFAKGMVQNPTYAENLLWQNIKRGVLKAKFVRQRVVLGYILDFYCSSLHLAIEVDGKIHNSANDEIRDLNLSKYGVVTIRFTNEQVTTEMPVVIEKLKSKIRELWGLPVTPVGITDQWCFSDTGAEFLNELLARMENKHEHQFIKGLIIQLSHRPGLTLTLKQRDYLLHINKFKPIPLHPKEMIP